MSGRRPPRLGCWPTPLHPVPGHPSLVLKREDLSGLGFGGNKVRALETVAEAVCRDRADVLVTGGRADSNWAALAALAARRLGIACHLVLDPYAGPEPTVVAVARGAGASVHHAPEASAAAVNDAVAELAAGLRSTGRRCLAVPRAGASPAAVLGYGSLADELAGHLAAHRGARVWLPAGSGTTAAGLCLGLVRAGVDGACVSAVAVHKPADVLRQRIEDQIGAAADLVGRPDLVRAAVGLLDVLDPPAGAGPALDRLRDATAVLVDPVFGEPTWRALAHRIAEEDGVPAPAVLVASGGLPAALDALRAAPPGGGPVRDRNERP